MSAIENGKKLIRRVGNNIPTRETSFAKNIGELIAEIEKQQVVINAVKNLINFDAWDYKNRPEDYIDRSNEMIDVLRTLSELEESK